MSTLRFPTDRIVGTVEWNASWSDERGSVLATGAIEIPDGVAVDIEIQSVLGSEPTGGGSWSITPAREAVHLGFLQDLPDDAVESGPSVTPMRRLYCDRPSRSRPSQALPSGVSRH